MHACSEAHLGFGTLSNCMGTKQAFGEAGGFGALSNYRGTKLTNLLTLKLATIPFKVYV